MPSAGEGHTASAAEESHDSAKGSGSTGPVPVGRRLATTRKDAHPPLHRPCADGRNDLPLPALRRPIIRSTGTGPAGAAVAARCRVVVNRLLHRHRVGGGWCRAFPAGLLCHARSRRDQPQRQTFELVHRSSLFQFPAAGRPLKGRTDAARIAWIDRRCAFRRCHAGNCSATRTRPSTARNRPLAEKNQGPAKRRTLPANVRAAKTCAIGWHTQCSPSLHAGILPIEPPRHGTACAKQWHAFLRGSTSGTRRHVRVCGGLARAAA